MTMARRPGAGFEHGSIEVFGHEVGWTSNGSSPRTLVICPGSAGSEPSWAKDMWSEYVQVVELNPPGWGGREPLRHKIDQRDLAVVLAAAIEALGIERFHLHGASMGGVTALWLAAQFPDRILSLSIEGGMNFVRQSDLVSPEKVRVLEQMVETQNPDGVGYPKAVPHPRKPWSDAAFIRGQMIKRLPMMRMVTNLHESDLATRITRLQVPILALLGEHDELLRPSHLERWKEIHPDVETLLVSGAAHDIQNTEPEQLVAAVMRHLHSGATAIS